MERDLDFHFNEWSLLAQIDPASFERRRQQLIAQFLSESGKHRPRLEFLQATIDAARERTQSPEEAVMLLSAKLCASLVVLEETLKALVVDLSKRQASDVSPRP